MKNREYKRKKIQPILGPLITHRQFLIICTVIPAVVILFDMADIFHWKCPFLWITGLPCAGCGMTRAGISMLNGDFFAAVSYHPFSFVFAVGWILFVVLLFFSDEKRKAVSAKIARIEEKSAIIYILFFFFIIFGLTRLIFQLFIL